MNMKWVLCPHCGNKTRVQIRGDTELKHFPLYCPKCKTETLIDLKGEHITIIKSQTLRRRADDRQSKDCGHRLILITGRISLMNSTLEHSKTEKSLHGGRSATTWLQPFL